MLVQGNLELLILVVLLLICSLRSDLDKNSQKHLGRSLSLKNELK